MVCKQVLLVHSGVNAPRYCDPGKRGVNTRVAQNRARVVAQRAAICPRWKRFGESCLRTNDLDLRMMRFRRG